MAKHNCAICGAEIGLTSEQKLADGTYICRKNCRAKAFPQFDYLHGTLPQVQAHLAQVDRGTALWNHYFVPRKKTKDKSQKLKNFSPVFVAPDIGLMALVRPKFKFIIFGKTETACVYRIADLYSYETETENGTNSEGKQETKYYTHLFFRNTDGLYEFRISQGNYKSCEAFAKYFDGLFGIQKNLKSAKNTWNAQMNAIKSVTAGVAAVASGAPDAEAKAQAAVDAMDAAAFGDRTEWIRKADAALAAFPDAK